MNARDVVLVGCCGPKLDRAAPARDLYTSPLFRASVAYATARGVPWAIVSAKHGLVLPGQVLEPYDATFRSLGYGKGERLAWALRVQRAAWERWPGARFVFLAGAAYRGCVATRFRGIPLSGVPLKFVEPLAGLQIGQRLAWLALETERLKAAPREREEAPCDFCGEIKVCAISEIGPQRFAGDHLPARICEACATWALERLRAVAAGAVA